jgi:hypothetical protein
MIRLIVIGESISRRFGVYSDRARIDISCVDNIHSRERLS